MKPVTALALLLTLAAAPLAAQHAAVTVHVALDGDDAVDGTADQPVRSLGRAQELVRAARKEHPDRDVDVLLHEGTWHLDAPLRFGPADGGDAERKVTWRGEGRAAIDGGRPITGWTVGDDGVWTTRVDPSWRFRELFVKGRPRPRARHPDDGFLRIEKAAPDRRSGFTFRAGDITPVDDVDQVELVFLHDWSISRVGVKSIDVASATLTTTDPIGANAPHYAIDNFEPHPRYFLENSRAFLDQPGEWFLDRDTGELSYLPRELEDPNRTSVIAPVAPRLVEVSGDETNRVRNLHFVGITFAHCAWQIPEHGYAEGQANYHEPRTAESGILREIVPAAIHFERAQSCTIRDGYVLNMGTGGVWFGSQCHECALEHTVVWDVASNGVLIGEDQNRRIDGEVWWRAAPGQIATGNAVRDCVILKCGRQFFGAVGIWVGFARDTEIARNKLHDLPYTGISLGWIWNPTLTPCGGHRVHDNEISHVMQVLSDGGGIYTLGRQPGTVLAHNLIHDIPVNMGRAESNGMFLDEGTTDIVIEDNVIWNVDRSPLRFHRATTNDVRNNVLIVRGDTPPVRYNATKPEDIRLEDNVVAREVDSGR